MKGGAPDFLMLQVGNQEIRDVLAVEVKRKGSQLTYEQLVFKMILERAGFRYVVEVEP